MNVRDLELDLRLAAQAIHNGDSAQAAAIAGRVNAEITREVNQARYDERQRANSPWPNKNS